ncbi:MAG: hypothetical protein JRH07_11680 [Deltaproteobacteria bacterium]|nr:hypothetical protein [Deltaproteobacteria bacterium]
MATERIKRLYQDLLDARPSISVERARIYTEAIRDAGGMSVIMQRAVGLSKVLKEKEVRINDRELIVGSLTEKERGAIVTPEFGWRGILAELDLFPAREADRLEISKEEREELRALFRFWKGKSVEENVDSLLSRRAQRALKTGLTTLGGHSTSLGNITPDYPMLLRDGLDGIRARVSKRLRETRADCPGAIEKIDFYRAALVAIDGVIRFAERYARLAGRLAGKEASPERRGELERIARICRQVPRLPARDFHEAIQSLWFIHLVFHIESSPHAILLGRIDQYLYPFYERDLRENRLTREEAKELLECLWIKTTELIKIQDDFYSRAFSGFPLFQVAMVGGVDGDGDDVTNDLSHLILEVVGDVRTTQPSISLRYNQRTPDDFMRKACRVVASGLGIPAFVNDGVIIPKMLRRGATLEEARDYVTNCIEPEIPGMTDSRAHSGYVNFGKCIELVMNNGIDPLSGERVGVETGEPRSLRGFDDFLGAVLEQIRFAVGLIEQSYNACELVHSRLAPEVFLSLFISDCIESGKTRQAGGARYNHSTIFGTGLATLVDSLAAVRKVVYEEGIVGLDGLNRILCKDFAGEERFRQMLLNRCPKYGNDLDEVDSLARRVVRFFCETVQSRNCLRGGTGSGCGQGRAYGGDQIGRKDRSPERSQRHASQPEILPGRPERGGRLREVLLPHKNLFRPGRPPRSVQRRGRRDPQEGPVEARGVQEPHRTRGGLQRLLQ